MDNWRHDKFKTKSPATTLAYYVYGDFCSSFGMWTSRRAGQGFGIGTGSLNVWRIAITMSWVYSSLS